MGNLCHELRHMPWFHVSKYFEKSGFVIAKRSQSEGGSVSKYRMFLVSLQCKINLIEKDHW